MRRREREPEASADSVPVELLAPCYVLDWLGPDERPRRASGPVAHVEASVRAWRRWRSAREAYRVAHELDHEQFRAVAGSSGQPPRWRR